MKLILSLIFLITFISCSNITMIQRGDRKNFYGAGFLNKIEAIKKEYREGSKDKALTMLREINDAKLNPTEVAMRYNLMGVIFFAKENYEEATIYFERAMITPVPDEFLMAQIGLNLGSTYFKQDDIRRGYDVLKSTNPDRLEGEENKKYYRLFYMLSSQLGEYGDSVRGLIGYVGNVSTISELKGHKNFETLVNQFARLGQTQKVRILEEFVAKKYISIAYLGYIESESLFYQAEKKKSEDMVEWIRENFKENAEVIALVGNFEQRLESVSKIDPTTIGIVLPFSKVKRDLSERALRGIDMALSQFKAEGKTAPNVYFEDSAANGVVGAEAVKKLVNQRSVAVIIGGLTSKEAVKEYLEARKYGVMFISLSPIYLPKNEKNYLLLEIPASVESQVNKILSSNTLEQFGKSLSVLYPSNSRGKAFIDELWGNTEVNNEFKIASLQSYEDGVQDFRLPVSKILNLAFKRERQEELDYYKEIYSLEGRRSIRRVQNLSPIVDFDWVFMPTYPKEALKIIPSFNYFDAPRVKFVGGPSWRSSSLSKKLTKLGSVYFVGEDLSKTDAFGEAFRAKFNIVPRVIETFSYDSMRAALKFLESPSDKRENFNFSIMTGANIEGVTGNWELKDGLWIKELSMFRVRRSGIQNLDKAEMASPEETSVEPVTEEIETNEASVEKADASQV